MDVERPQTGDNLSHIKKLYLRKTEISVAAAAIWKEWSGMEHHFSLQASIKLIKPNQAETDKISTIMLKIPESSLSKVKS